jgi:hypothetical protein
MGMENAMPGDFSAEPQPGSEGDPLLAAFEKFAAAAGARNTLDRPEAVEAALAARREEFEKLGPDAGGEIEA